MMEPIREIHGKHATAEIHYDDGAASNPREWDNVGTIVSTYGYNFGDEHVDDGCDLMLSLLAEFDPDRANKLIVERYIKGEEVEDAIESAFLYHYAALGVWSSTRDGGLFADEGDLDKADGIIYVSMRRAWDEAAGTQPNDEAVRKWAMEMLKLEVQTYSEWRMGEVYGIVILDPHGEVDDSCWGFYGDPFDDDGYLVNEAREMLALGDQEWERRVIHDPDNMTPFGGRHGQYS